MRLEEKEKELNNYLNEWVNSRYEDLCLFYNDIHRDGHHWMHDLKHGERLEQLLENIKGAIDEYLRVTEEQHIIPSKFSSIDQLLKALNRFGDMIKAEQPYIEDNLHGEDTDYKAFGLYRITFDIINMVERCNKAYIYDENLIEPYQKLKTLLYQNNIKGFLEQLSSILSTIPARVRKEKMNEAYFHIMVHTCLVTIGFNVLSEVATNIGFIDLTVNLPKNIYVFEFKYSKDSCDQSEMALQQIEDKNYCNGFKYHLKPIWGIGVSFEKKKKNINGHKIKLLYEPDRDVVNKLLSKSKS